MVRAVEGKDSEDVVTRGLELVEGAGLGGPLANAAIARDTQEPQTVAMPATIGGAAADAQAPRRAAADRRVAGFAGRYRGIGAASRGHEALRRGAAGDARSALGRVAQFAPDRGLAFCNQPFRRLFAMKNEWLADRPEFDRVLERMREANRLPDVRDFPAWKAERREWFLAPEAVEETWVIAGTHLRVVAQPLPEGGLLLIFEDRTQQLELQREHGEMQQVRTATLESLSEAVAVFGKGRLQLWNRKFASVWEFEDGFLDGHPQSSRCRGKRRRGSRGRDRPKCSARWSARRGRTASSAARRSNSPTGAGSTWRRCRSPTAMRCCRCSTPPIGTASSARCATATRRSRRRTGSGPRSSPT
ncbi:MAG: PAS-domain containing protein [Sphingomonas sp.]